MTVGRDEAAYHAFVPHPLPPALEFDIELARGEWRLRLTERRASARLLQLADSLFETPLLTISRAQRILGVSYPTAQANVQKLVRAGILQQTGEGEYGKTYFAPPIYAVIEQPSPVGN